VLGSLCYIFIYLFFIFGESRFSFLSFFLPPSLSFPGFCFIIHPRHGLSHEEHGMEYNIKKSTGHSAPGSLLLANGYEGEEYGEYM